MTVSDVTFDPVILNPKILCDFRTGHFLTNFPPRTLTFSNQLVTEPPTGHFLFKKRTPRDNTCRIISGTCGVDYQKTIIPALLVKVGAALLHPLPGRRLRGGPCRPQRPTFPLNQADRAMHGNPLRAHGPELQVDGHMAVFHTGQAPRVAFHSHPLKGVEMVNSINSMLVFMLCCSFGSSHGVGFC